MQIEAYRLMTATLQDSDNFDAWIGILGSCIVIQSFETAIILILMGIIFYFRIEKGFSTMDEIFFAD